MSSFQSLEIGITLAEKAYFYARTVASTSRSTANCGPLIDLPQSRNVCSREVLLVKKKNLVFELERERKNERGKCEDFFIRLKAA